MPPKEFTEMPKEPKRTRSSRHKIKHVTEVRDSYIAREGSMEEMVSKHAETSPTLERKRAKYTVEDVRQLCGGISRSTVMREIRRKRLACYRARRTLRFSEEHITRYLERVEQGVK